MSVYVAFDGGASYSPETIASEYPSLRAAIAEYRDRGSNSYFPCWGDPRCHDYDERGRRYVAYGYLTVPNGAFADVDGPMDTHDVYPDVVLVEGPRGGLSWEPA